MKIVNVNFNQDKPTDHGWKWSNKEDGSKYSSLVCNVGEKFVFVSSSKRLIEKINVNKDAYDTLDNLTVLPLYNKALLDEERRKVKGCYAVHITTEEAERIINIKLTGGCAALMSKVSKDRKEVALIVIVYDDDYSIEIYQSNNNSALINSDGELTYTSYDYKVREYNQLKIKRLLFIPKNALIARCKKGEDIESKEGFITVSIAALLSSNSVVISKPKNMILSDKLTQADKDDVNKRLDTALPLSCIYVDPTNNYSNK